MWTLSILSIRNIHVWKDSSFPPHTHCSTRDHNTEQVYYMRESSRCDVIHQSSPPLSITANWHLADRLKQIAVWTTRHAYLSNINMFVLYNSTKCQGNYDMICYWWQVYQFITELGSMFTDWSNIYNAIYAMTLIIDESVTYNYTNLRKCMPPIIERKIWLATLRVRWKYVNNLSLASSKKAAEHLSRPHVITLATEWDSKYTLKLTCCIP